MVPFGLVVCVLDSKSKGCGFETSFGELSSSQPYADRKLKLRREVLFCLARNPFAVKVFSPLDILTHLSHSPDLIPWCLCKKQTDYYHAVFSLYIAVYDLKQFVAASSPKKIFYKIAR